MANEASYIATIHGIGDARVRQIDEQTYQQLGTGALPGGDMPEPPYVIYVYRVPAGVAGELASWMQEILDGGGAIDGQVLDQMHGAGAERVIDQLAVI